MMRIPNCNIWKKTLLSLWLSLYSIGAGNLLKKIVLFIFKTEVKNKTLWPSHTLRNLLNSIKE
jgi:hypothetical protein